MTEEIIPTYISIYAVKESILARVGYLPQPPQEALVNDVMKSADDTVNGKLASYGLPTFNEDSNDVPEVLVTAANYYAISDLLQSLYGKDDRSTNEEGFYQKAENLMSNYIQQQLDVLADTALKEKSPYGFSQSPDAYDLGLLHR